MSTLEKFGILVILILVVIIGVVAVWGVGGEEINPFDAAATGDGTAVAEGALAADPAAPAPPDWPGTGAVPATVSTPGAPVAPPVVGSSISPAAPSAAPSSPAVAGGAKYRIKKGDTGASIAKALLGDANRWKEIEAANPGLNARRLKIGHEITVPNGSSMAAASTPPAPRLPNPNTLFPNPADGPTAPEAPGAVPTATPAPADSAKSYREVEVRSGDTLYEIARRELGNPDLYFKIIQANPGIDPKRIKPGQKVRVPVDG